MRTHREAVHGVGQGEDGGLVSRQQERVQDFGHVLDDFMPGGVRHFRRRLEARGAANAGRGGGNVDDNLRDAVNGQADDED